MGFFSGSVTLNGIQLKGFKDTTADLPLTGNTQNDVYMVRSDDHWYTWNKAESSGLITDWVDMGGATSIAWSIITDKPSSSVSDIDSAVSLKHNGSTQDTAIGLNTTHRGVVTGNPHSVSKSNVGLGNVDNKSEATIITNVKADSDVADAISKKHAQNSDTQLGTMAANINMNSHKLTGLSVPSTDGDSIRATSKITEAALESTIDDVHTQNSDTQLDSGVLEVDASDNLVLTQNSVAVMTSLNESAVANTLYLKEGFVGLGTNAPGCGLHVGADDVGRITTAINSIGDAFIRNDLQVQSNLWLGGSGRLNFYDTTNSKYYASFVKVIDEGFHLGIGTDDGRANRNFVIVDYDYVDNDYDHSTLSADPTLFIHSATAAATATNQWISFTHDKTDGVITTGKGTLNLGSADGKVNFSTATRVASTVTHDGYVELEIAGSSYKFMLGS